MDPRFNHGARRVGITVIKAAKEEVMPETEVVKHSVWAFGWTVTLGIIVIVFCTVYFYARRKKSAKHVDQKAGDEGED
jgi:uncharacterized BrkB/YihY/UPF0761 family membrane protein